MKTQTLGGRLRILRNVYGLTSEKLATMVDVTRVTIENIEKGTSNPYRSNLEKIATRLGSTAEWLADGKGDMLPNGKVKLLELKPASEFDPARDTLYNEMKSQISFLQQIVMQLTGGKGVNSFLQALNQSGLTKKRRLGAAA